MNKKTFDSIVGKKRLVNAMIDSDGDGYGNLIDCKPYNKHKQGWIHDAASAVGRAGSSVINTIKERAESDRARAGEERVAREATQVKARAAAFEEREKQTIATARYKVQQEAAHERAFILRRSRMGGGMDYLRAAGREFHRPTQIYGSSGVARKKVTKYVKKGKHYVKRTRTIRTGTQGNQTNNAGQVKHDILGTNLRF